MSQPSQTPELERKSDRENWEEAQLRVLAGQCLPVAPSQILGTGGKEHGAGAEPVLPPARGCRAAPLGWGCSALS